MNLEAEIKRLNMLNRNLLLILGMTVPFVHEYKNLDAFGDASRRCYWILRAIEEVVYHENPLPEFTW